MKKYLLSFGFRFECANFLPILYRVTTIEVKFTQHQNYTMQMKAMSLLCIITYYMSKILG